MSEDTKQLAISIAGALIALMVIIGGCSRAQSLCIQSGGHPALIFCSQKEAGIE